MNNTIGGQLKIIEIIHLLQWPYWSCIKCLEMKNKIEKKHLLQFIEERDKMIRLYINITDYELLITFLMS
ncbi:hypothetical protein ENUP19_0161G0022 [Entamoeba nuttalli]|uniref:Uncharacterized protein n=1 Tax=Entamoeba nuttalli TaxID=412467 RepID=A0ABQ0DLM7_9EUKA